MRTRVKICGLTREGDVDAAVEAGADALGFVFYEKSPRYVSPHQARRLIQRLPPWVSPVGLFVNAAREVIESTADAVGLAMVQLHGDESPELCSAIGRPVIKAIRLGGVLNDPQALENLCDHYADCQSLLFDSDSSGFGGSGRRFDWGLLAPVLPRLGHRWVLSGGLGPEQVGAAIAKLMPPAVDVSSGVEEQDHGEPRKGLKDAARMQAFLSAVSQADAQKAQTQMRNPS